jgi:hypothetical protein
MKILNFWAASSTIYERRDVRLPPPTIKVSERRLSALTLKESSAETSIKMWTEFPKV